MTTKSHADSLRNEVVMQLSGKEDRWTEKQEKWTFNAVATENLVVINSELGSEIIFVLVPT